MNKKNYNRTHLVLIGLIFFFESIFLYLKFYSVYNDGGHLGPDLMEILYSGIPIFVFSTLALSVIAFSSSISVLVKKNPLIENQKAISLVTIFFSIQAVMVVLGINISPHH